MLLWWAILKREPASCILNNGAAKVCSESLFSEVFHPAPRCGHLFGLWTGSRVIREGRYQEKVELCRLFGPTAGGCFLLLATCCATPVLSLYHPQRSPPGWLISGSANTLPRCTAHMNIWLFFWGGFCFLVYLWIFKVFFFVFFLILRFWIPSRHLAWYMIYYCDILQWVHGMCVLSCINATIVSTFGDQVL